MLVKVFLAQGHLGGLEPRNSTQSHRAANLIQIYWAEGRVALHLNGKSHQRARGGDASVRSSGT